jgi:hypothetical protein
MEVINTNTWRIDQIDSKKLFVTLGYGLGFNSASLEFITSEMLADEACEIVVLIKRFNAYNGEQVAKVIKKIDALWPSTNQHVTFQFGREYSPVLYVHFPYWKSQTERFEQRDGLIEKSIDLLRICNPDELDEDSIGYRVRAWWD